MPKRLLLIILTLMNRLLFVLLLIPGLLLAQNREKFKSKYDIDDLDTSFNVKEAILALNWTNSVYTL